MILIIITLVLLAIVTYCIVKLQYQRDIARIDRDLYRDLLEIQQDYTKAVETSRDRCMDGWERCAKEVVELRTARIQALDGKEVSNA